MKIVSTSDVSLDDLRTLAEEVRPDLTVGIDTSQIFLRSADPPSLVALLGEADWWVKAMAGFAALYVAELVKEAAKDSWRNRRKALVVAKAAGDQIRRLAVAIASLRHRLAERTTIAVGLPVPNEFFATRLVLEGDDPDELALQLALFVHHLPALSDLITANALGEGRDASTGLLLRLREDGALLVSWHDGETHTIREHVLSLRSTV